MLTEHTLQKRTYVTQANSHERPAVYRTSNVSITQFLLSRCTTLWKPNFISFFISFLKPCMCAFFLIICKKKLVLVSFYCFNQEMLLADQWKLNWKDQLRSCISYPTAIWNLSKVAWKYFSIATMHCS